MFRFSQNILMLRQQVDSTHKQVASLGQEPQEADPLRGEQLRELQAQLESLRSKMHQMQALERTFSQTRGQLEVRAARQTRSTTRFSAFMPPHLTGPDVQTQKTRQEEELMKTKLQAALQEVCVHCSFQQHRVRQQQTCQPFSRHPFILTILFFFSLS